jgi:cobalt-zinc-cadmium efflux system protein
MLRMALRAPTERFTYGWRSSTILASLTNAVLLLLASGALAIESVERLMQPSAVPGVVVIAVAGAGVLINGFTAWLLLRGDQNDLNVRGAYLHMAADAAISLGVVVAGLLIWFTGQAWIDPVASLLVVGVIVWGTWGLLKQSTRLALHAVPPHIDPKAVKATLAAWPNVTEVHDLHIWPMSTTHVAMTAHLVTAGGHPGDAWLANLCHAMEHQFGIGHCTVQIELGQDGPCALAPADVV